MSFVACVGAVSGETIELKDGKTIVGEIIRETEDALVVSKEGGDFIYSIARDRVKNIRGSTADEISEEESFGVSAGAAEEKAKREELREYRLEEYEKEVEMAKQARGRVKIKFVEGRPGVVEALLNGKVRVNLLADTGASLVYLSKGVADRLGIGEDDYEGTIHAQLADGSLTTDKAITLKSVKVGPAERKNVKAGVASGSSGGSDGLLGMSFLQHFHVKMDAKENCLVLEKY